MSKLQLTTNEIITLFDVVFSKNIIKTRLKLREKEKNC